MHGMSRFGVPRRTGSLILAVVLCQADEVVWMEMFCFETQNPAFVLVLGGFVGPFRMFQRLTLSRRVQQPVGGRLGELGGCDPILHHARPAALAAAAAAAAIPTRRC